MSAAVLGLPSSSGGSIDAYLFPQFPGGCLRCSFTIIKAAADGEPVPSAGFGRGRTLQEQYPQPVYHQYAGCLVGRCLRGYRRPDRLAWEAAISGRF